MPNHDLIIIGGGSPDHLVTAVRSPRFANPQDAGNFRKRVVEIRKDERGSTIRPWNTRDVK